MKKAIPVIMTCLMGLQLFGQKQWHLLHEGPPGRTEDISVWDFNQVLACGGGTNGIILRSMDGCQNWDTVLKSNYYLRSVEWLNASTAFCGSLDSVVFMSSDSGKSWVDITNRLPRKIYGICGMDAINGVIHLTGNFYDDAYCFYSVNGGTSFIEGNLSDTGKAVLVDIHFISPDTGFAIGGVGVFDTLSLTTNPVIYRTIDSGKTWSIQYFDEDTIIVNHGWKIFHERNNLLVSIQRFSSLKFLESVDRGMTWQQRRIPMSTEGNVQGIGTLDFQNIYLGFHDFGESWLKLYNSPQDSISIVRNAADTSLADDLAKSSINKFEKVSDDLLLGAGNGIWALYDPTVTNLTAEKLIAPQNHYLPEIEVFPNPLENNEVNFRLNLPSKTKMLIVLMDGKGGLVDMFHDGYIDKGEHHFSSTLNGVSPGTYYVVVRCFEGTFSKPFVVN